MSPRFPPPSLTRFSQNTRIGPSMPGVVLQVTLGHSCGSHLCPVTGQRVSSPTKDVPVLGSAPGSHRVQMDDIPCACLCFASWGCDLWALLYCSKCFKIPALRSSSMCSPCVRIKQFLCGPSWLLMQTLPYTEIHSFFIVWRISV